MLPIIDQFIRRFRASLPKFQPAKKSVTVAKAKKPRRIRRAIRDPRGYAFAKLFGGTLARDRARRPGWVNHARNPSLYNMGDGLEPVQVRTFLDGTRHFIFLARTALGRHVGFINRREIGQGHSSFERFDKREKRRKDYALRREYKRARRLEALAPAAA